MNLHKQPWIHFETTVFNKGLFKSHHCCACEKKQRSKVSETGKYFIMTNFIIHLSLYYEEYMYREELKGSFSIPVFPT